MADTIPAAFAAIVRLCEALGVRRINELPGCWEHEVSGWQIALNGHAEPTRSSRGVTVPPYTAAITHADYLVAMHVDPAGGAWAGGDIEDAFIAALETEIARVVRG